MSEYRSRVYTDRPYYADLEAPAKFQAIEGIIASKLIRYSFNKISKLLGLDWACVKQRYFDYIHDNPELLKEDEK